MGCDGGTIPRRDELVRTKKKKAVASKEVKAGARWNYCHLSQLPLQKPVVVDQLGNLYNKDKLIEYMLDRSKYENGPEYIKNLKDIKELNLTPNPSFDSNKQENGDESNTINKTQWICSITGLEMNGSFKFFCLFSCGCVFSERSYKSINPTSLKCIRCEKSYSENDLIILNPTEEELDINLNKMKARKEAIAKSKAEKAKTSTKDNQKCSEDGTLTKTKRPAESTSKSSTSEKSKKIKSIQDDPNTSDVYKSIFNTCDQAKNQQKAHWVTFNPLYN
ncbi:RTF2 -like protein [Brachionus plicatilis]|uniref:Replication termination factor 2 n=1 Tax=Brachionus plicatilis TaxID=10195 RepID=A0A3M7SXI0_BRAPC|nr:RTF2 -like protein [Brachionus plicatilis]